MGEYGSESKEVAGLSVVRVSARTGRDGRHLCHGHPLEGHCCEAAGPQRYRGTDKLRIIVFGESKENVKIVFGILYNVIQDIVRIRTVLYPHSVP